MSRIARLSALTLAPVLLVGCRNDDVAGPGASPAEAGAAFSFHGSGGSVADVSGDWNWSNKEVVRMEESLVLFLGLTPEGPNTMAHCQAAGTMTLLQTGTAFSGTASKTFDACETNGGQHFQRPGLPHFVEGGRIRGASAHFSFHAPIVRPCPHHAVISVDYDGVAIALSGTGFCFVPGHPKSESPLGADRPEGTSTTLRWEAVRP